jgi:DNA-binding MarR family transcriptional regulator
MRFDKTRSAGHLINHAARLFAHALHDRMKHLGLAPAQFMALVELWETDGLTQAELTERLGVEQATLAGTLARMERDGLIKRQPHPDDRRAKRNLLTAEAKSREAPAKAAASSTHKAALAELTEAETEQFILLINKIISALKEDRRNGHP